MENEKLNVESLLLLDIKGADLENQNIEFPFKVTLSFKVLIEHIQSVVLTGSELKKKFAQSILDELTNYPELLEPIHDTSILKRSEKIISDMMMFVFPDAFWEMQTYAAAHPFIMNIFYESPRFKQLIKAPDGTIRGEMNLDLASFNFGRTVGGYAAILNEIYGMNLVFDFPIIYKIPDPVTMLDAYYKMNMAGEFMDIVVKGKIRELSDKDKEEIRENIYDLNFMKEMLPAENFEIQGFLVMNAINITDTEILSAMKKDLIEKETITSLPGFLKLQHKLKSLLRCPGLLLGLADFPGSTDRLFQYGRKIGNSFLMNDYCLKCSPSLKNSIYEYSFESKKVVIIEDLEKYPNRTKIEDEILKQGIKNILIAPLIYGDEIIGILELGSPEAGMISKINTLKLREVLPLFTLAVARSKEEMKNRVQAIVKEKCTAIHPTLEWRFRNAALKVLQNENEGRKAEMEEIVFHDVYPLYGLSDIRNSSLQRNNAIKEDLVENLNLALEVIASAKKYKSLHAFDEITYRINKKIDSLKFSIDSGDEARTLDFLRKQVVPTFEYLRSYNSEVKKNIEDYNNNLDNKLGFVYKKRKEYEESATRINDVIAGFLDEEQEKVQKLFPHYFERYKTDGVDHNIYIGSSLVEDGKFNKLYLRNIRLWQLIMTCGIVRKTKGLKKDLSLPLETAHMILVQSAPLSIRFRFDEKKFDVDGAYNVRYEIMKKRIDKAEIKGREERLTQPEKIAIVYSQTSEAQEYFEYIEYLQANNYLNREIEELELEELQGVKGLKALRVQVNTDNKEISEYVNNEKIKKAVERMSVN